MPKLSRLLIGFVPLVLVVILSGCQGGGLLGTSARGTVPEEDRIPLAATAQSTWNTDMVSLDYRYAHQGDSLDIQGLAHYLPALTANFDLMKSFHMDVIFADAQGKVLGMHGLATSGDFDPVTFNVKAAVPYNTAYLAFSYRGEAIEASHEDGGGPYSFWKWPIR